MSKNRMLFMICLILLVSGAILALTTEQIGPGASVAVLGGLIPNLNLGGILPSRPAQRTQAPFKSHFGITDGDAAYDTEAEVVAIIGALAAGSVWTKIWEKTVPAQQQIRWGFGSPDQPHNQGYMYFVSVDEAANFQIGVLRLQQAKARETVVYVVQEIDDSRLHGTTNTTTETATPVNINEMMALPEQVRFPKVGEDSLLQLYYRCVTAATAEDAAAFSIPVSIYQ